MTLYKAVKSELLQYTASRSTIDKALADAGLESSETYRSADHKQTVAKVVVSILRRFLSLQSESEGGFSQSYSIDGLKKYLKSFAAENGISDLVEDLTDDNTIVDKSDIW